MDYLQVLVFSYFAKFFILIIYAFQLIIGVFFCYFSIETGYIYWRKFLLTHLDFIELNYYPVRKGKKIKSKSIFERAFFSPLMDG